MKLISFARLCSTLDIKAEAQKVELLKCIQQVAEFVQGNWVVKSEVIYPGAEKDKPAKLCGVSGVHPDVLSKGRDYIVRNATLLLPLRNVLLHILILNIPSYICLLSTVP